MTCMDCQRSLADTSEPGKSGHHHYRLIPTRSQNLGQLRQLDRPPSEPCQPRRQAGECHRRWGWQMNLDVPTLNNRPDDHAALDAVDRAYIPVIVIRHVFHSTMKVSLASSWAHHRYPSSATARDLRCKNTTLARQA